MKRLSCILVFVALACISCTESKVDQILEKETNLENASLYGIWTITERTVKEARPAVEEKIDDEMVDGEEYDEDYDESYDESEGYDYYNYWRGSIEIEVPDTSYSCLTVSIRPDGICYVLEDVNGIPDDHYYNQKVNGHLEGTIPSDCPLSIENSFLQFKENSELDYSVLVHNGALVPAVYSWNQKEPERLSAYKVVQVSSFKDPTDKALCELSRKKYDYSERRAVYKGKDDEGKKKYGYVYGDDKYVDIAPQFDAASPFRHGYAVVSKDGKEMIINRSNQQQFTGSYYLFSEIMPAYKVDFDKKTVSRVTGYVEHNVTPESRKNNNAFVYDWEAPLVLDDYYNVGFEEGGMTVYLTDWIASEHPDVVPQQNEEELTEAVLYRRWENMRPYFPVKVSGLDPLYSHSNGAGFSNHINRAESEVIPLYYYLLAHHSSYSEYNITNDGYLLFEKPNSNLRLILQDDGSNGAKGRATLVSYRGDNQYALQSVAYYQVDSKGLHLWDQKSYNAYTTIISVDQPVKYGYKNGDYEHDGYYMEFGEFISTSRRLSDNIMFQLSKMNGFLDGRSPQQIGGSTSIYGSPNPAIERMNQANQESDRIRREMNQTTDPNERRQMERELDRLRRQQEAAQGDIIRQMTGGY